MSGPTDLSGPDAAGRTRLRPAPSTRHAPRAAAAGATVSVVGTLALLSAHTAGARRSSDRTGGPTPRP
jgi:hypothetical protein